MKAKEKAEQLVIQMYQPLPASKEAEKGKEHLYYNQFNAAKQCALIAVDEIIKAINFDWMEVQNLESEHRYWQEVKQEIENIGGQNE